MLSIKLGRKMLSCKKKNPPDKLISGGDKEEAKMLTQNSKSAFRKHKPPKNFILYI